MNKTLEQRVLDAKEGLIKTEEFFWTEEALEDIEVASEIVKMLVSKDVDILTANWILRRAGQILERIKIG